MLETEGRGEGWLLEDGNVSDASTVLNLNVSRYAFDGLVLRLICSRRLENHENANRLGVVHRS